MKVLARYLCLLLGALLSPLAVADEARAVVPAPTHDAAGEVLRPTADAPAGALAADGGEQPDADRTADPERERKDGEAGAAGAGRRDRAQQDPLFLLLLQILRTPK